MNPHIFPLIMGRPATTHLLVQEIHAALLESGLRPGDMLPRIAFQRLVMLGAGVSISQERNIALNGEVLGYWRRLAVKEGRPHWIEVRQGPVQLGLGEADPP